MKLLIAQSSPVRSHTVSLRRKYLAQRDAHNQHEFAFTAECKDAVSILLINNIFLLCVTAICLHVCSSVLQFNVITTSSMSFGENQF